MEQIREILEQYSLPRNIPGERERAFNWIIYEANLPPGAAEAELPAQEVSEPPSRPPDAAAAPVVPAALRRAVFAGAMTYARKDLERAIARGETLDINVLGYCSFAADVTPELVERAVARFRCRGVVSAPPAVREALKRKEG
jgi:hypothetical protein